MLGLNEITFGGSGGGVINVGLDVFRGGIRSSRITPDSGSRKGTEIKQKNQKNISNEVHYLRAYSC